MTKQPLNTLKSGDKVVCLSDPWDKLDVYIVHDVSIDIKLAAFPKGILDRNIVRTIPLAQISALVVSPYNRQTPPLKSPLSQISHFVANLAKSILRDRADMSPAGLVQQLKQDPRLAAFKDENLEVLIKCMVACGQIDAAVRTTGRKASRQQSVALTLSKGSEHLEKSRTFAGTFAGELVALSERVRHLISHPGAVGSYRENLLQTLLRRFLPERYHVATGFIYGCPRQLDILIYDRLEYPVMFREGDLVVVPPASVRAVIEVKTRLGKNELWSSLEQIAQVSELDDLSPPFFKGIFAFEASLSGATLLQHLASFYADMPEDGWDSVNLSDLNPEDEHLAETGFQPISHPYRHLTSLCVLDSLYAYIDYEKSEQSGNYEAALWQLRSATGLNAQASHFLDQLSAYLSIGQLKGLRNYPFRKSLGADTIREQASSITAGYVYPWGAYFEEAQGMESAAESRVLLETTIEKTTRWLEL